MATVEAILEDMRDGKTVRFSDLCKICETYFGKHRQTNGSHRIYKTPWKGDPRINIQPGKNGKAKKYQIKQVLKAIAKKNEGATDV